MHTLRIWAIALCVFFSSIGFALEYQYIWYNYSHRYSEKAALWAVIGWWFLVCGFIWFVIACVAHDTLKWRKKHGRT